MIKKVILRRKETKSFLPKEIQLESRMYLSSVYKDRQPLRAFTAEDCKKHLNGLLDVDPSHVDWPKHEKKETLLIRKTGLDTSGVKDIHM